MNAMNLPTNTNKQPGRLSLLQVVGLGILAAFVLTLAAVLLIVLPPHWGVLLAAGAVLLLVMLTVSMTILTRRNPVQGRGDKGEERPER